MKLKDIIQYASYAVAGVVLLSLVSANPVHIGIVAVSAAAYFIAEKVL